jgi:hypothetical protein
MGLFSFGGSKSQSSSRSLSSSFDNLDSFGFGFDTSTSASRSGGQSSSFDRSGSQSGQRVAFEDVFADLFGNAAGAAAGIDTGNISGAANLLFNAGGGIIDDLQGGGIGAAALEERLANRDGLADQQIDQLGSDLQRFLSEDVSGAITSSGVQANTLGGSRGEVQAGIAERGAIEAFSRGSTDIRLADQASRDAIAGQLMASEAERGSTSLAALPQLFGLADAGAMAELSPLMALSQILGPQLALTESQSFGLGGSESSQFSEALAEALGLSLDRTTGRAGSQSSSSSSSSSRSLSLGLE